MPTPKKIPQQKTSNNTLPQQNFSGPSKPKTQKNAFLKSFEKGAQKCPQGVPGGSLPMQHVFFGKQLEFQGDTLGIQRHCPGASLGKISCRLLPSSPSKCGFIILVEFCTNIFQGFGQMPHLMRFGGIPGA